MAKFFVQLLMILRLIVSSMQYIVYDLEAIHMCYRGDTEKTKFYIQPWNAAIVRVGYRLDETGSQISSTIHNCKVTIGTDRNFGLMAVVEDLRIRGKKDKATNEWKCDDYVKFSTVGNSLVKTISSILSIPLKDKQSEKLCGENHNSGDSITSKRLSNFGTQADVFSTTANTLDIAFHQHQDPLHPVNNTFTIIVTSFKQLEDHACEGKFRCSGQEAACIDRSFLCDRHINCAFPSGGNDEMICNTEERKAEFTVTTIIFTVLGGLLCVGFLLCLLVTAINHFRAHNESPERTPSPVFLSPPVPSAPAFLHLSSLPPYEGSTLDSQNRELKAMDENAEMPPSYDSLYPKTRTEKDTPT